MNQPTQTPQGATEFLFFFLFKWNSFSFIWWDNSYSYNKSLIGNKKKREKRKARNTQEASKRCVTTKALLFCLFVFNLWISHSTPEHSRHLVIPATEHQLHVLISLASPPWLQMSSLVAPQIETCRCSFKITSLGKWDILFWGPRCRVGVGVEDHRGWRCGNCITTDSWGVFQQMSEAPSWMQQSQPATSYLWVGLARLAKSYFEMKLLSFF